MERTPVVSVVIPVYNAAHQLKACLDSVISQTLQELEIICVDDGSQDHSLKTLMKYASADKRIRVISQKHAGTAAARNTGLRRARGASVCFLDSDDRIMPDAMEKLSGILQKKALDVLIFDSENTYEDEKQKCQGLCGGSRKKRTREYYGVLSGAKMFVQMNARGDYHADCGGYMYSRSFLEEKKLLFCEDMLCGDELFSLQAMLKAQAVSHVNRTCRLKHILISVKQADESAEDNFRESFIAYGKMMRFVIENEWEETVYRSLWKRMDMLQQEAVSRYRLLTRAQRENALQTGDPLMKHLLDKSIYPAGKWGRVSGWICEGEKKLCGVCRTMKEKGLKETIHRIFKVIGARKRH